MAVKVTLRMLPLQAGDRLMTINSSHWLPGSTNLTSDDDKITALANARLNLCGSNIQLLSIQLALFPVTDPMTGRPRSTRQRNRICFAGSSITGANAFNQLPKLQSVPSFSFGNCDQPKASIQIDLGGMIGGVGPKQFGREFMAGVPDGIITTGATLTPNLTNTPGWLNALGSYLQALSQGFAFLGVQQPPPGPGRQNIVRWSNEASGQLRLIMTMYTNPWIQGQVVHVRGLRGATGRQNLPFGLWRIDAPAVANADGTFSYTLQNTQGYSAANIVTPGTAEQYFLSFYNYDGTYSIMRATTRKRGARASSAVGRSRPRQRQLV